MKLNFENVQETADRLRCDASKILAVTMVETPHPHVGDLEPGKPLILNERHWFYKLSGSYPVSRDYPHLSAKSWGGYCTGRSWQDRQRCEHRRLEEKMSIYGGALKEAALKSISMGLFQVMGFNHEMLGYRSVFDMWEDAKRVDDTIDLRWFADFVEAKGIADELRRGDFAGFAKVYNGPSYRKNRYDVKMQEYDRIFKSKEEEYRRKRLLEEHELAALPVLPPERLETGFPDFSQSTQYATGHFA